MIFQYLTPILNELCKKMTSTEALQPTTWDALQPVLTRMLQQRVTDGVLVHDVRFTEAPVLAATGPRASVETLSGAIMARVWRLVYSVAGM